MDAAQIAGLNCLRLMNETTAGTLKCGVLCAGKATCYTEFDLLILYDILMMFHVR